MKRFREFTEAEIIRGNTKASKFNGIVNQDKPDLSGFEHHSDIGKTHSLHVMHYSNGSREYVAKNNKTGHADMHVEGKYKQHPNGQRTFAIGNLSGRSGSPLKAHQLYHHLITKHDHVLSSDYHTEGGANVWRSLAKHKDISIHGMHKGKPVNLDPHDPEDTHASSDEMRDDPGAKDTFHTTLVAHKRI